MQLFERGIRRDGHDVGAWRHHFAHALVAKFNDLLDQVRLFRLDDALFFRDLHKSLDSLLRALFLGLFDFVLRNSRERFRAFEKYAPRPDEATRAAQQGPKGTRPTHSYAVQDP